MTAGPTVTPQNRWFGVGRSSGPDASRAGAAAVDAAARGRRAKLLTRLNSCSIAASPTISRRRTAGFYTYGEIARVRGVGGFHNQTLAVLAAA